MFARIVSLALLCAALTAAAPAAAAELPFLTATWGTFGSLPGQFAYPGGVVADEDGYIYVADQGNNRIQKFTADGTLVMTWGTVGSGPGQLRDPARICIGPLNGEVYVVEHQNHRVSRFTKSGVFLGSFGSPGQALGQFSHPVGIDADDAGNIYVVEATNHRLQKFTSTGGFIATWGGLGIGPGQMFMPYGCEVDGNFVYVCEYNGNRVQKFTTNGTFVRAWGGEGTGPGQFRAAEGLVKARDGLLYVCDTGNDRIQQFTEDGQYLGQFPVPIGTEAELRPIPCDIAMDRTGDLYVVAFGSARVHKYHFAGANRPPDCSRAHAVPETLWPPNNKLVPVGIAGVFDPDGDPVNIRVTAVTQDEPVAGSNPRVSGQNQLPAEDELAGGAEPSPADDAPAADGQPSVTCPDAVIDAYGAAQLRAERSAGPGGNGRVYRVTFEASDGQSTTTGSVDVCVPQRSNRDCMDDGQTENSLGPCRPRGRSTWPATDLTLDAISLGARAVSIEFQLPAPAEVEIGLFDVTGRRVALLERAARDVGSHRLEWNPEGLRRGVYFLRIVTGSGTRTRTLVIR